MTIRQNTLIRLSLIVQQNSQSASWHFTHSLLTSAAMYDHQQSMLILLALIVVNHSGATKLKICFVTFYTQSTDFCSHLIIPFTVRPSANSKSQIIGAVYHNYCISTIVVVRHVL